MGMELIELIERIRAVLDEDERIAVAAAEAGEAEEWSKDEINPVLVHMSRHDPARVLRQVAAMREILEHASVMDQDGDYLASTLAEACGIEPGPNGAVAGTSAQIPHAPARIDAERRKGQPWPRR
jgi:hypothetical protein